MATSTSNQNNSPEEKQPIPVSLIFMMGTIVIGLFLLMLKLIGIF